MDDNYEIAPDELGDGREDESSIRNSQEADDDSPTELHEVAENASDRNCEGCPLCEHVTIQKYFCGWGQGDPKQIRDSERANMLHGSCEPCDTAELTSLCELCRHSRVGHLLRCCSKLILENYYVTEVRWDLGTWEECMRRQNCNFCHAMLCALSGEELNSVQSRGELETCKLRFHVSIMSDIVVTPYKIPSLARGYLYIIPATSDANPNPQRYLLYEPEFIPPGCEDVSPRILWQNIVGWPGLTDAALTVPDRSFPGFCLIDVNQYCIRAEPPLAPYAALSYVWGASEQELVLGTKNFDELQQSGSLLKADVPAIIRDSMTVCIQLGLSYLWVDRLCIVQDDDGIKTAQIRQMGHIYKGASVTLVALEQEDVWQGLPGVSTDRGKETDGFLYLDRVTIGMTYGDTPESVRTSTWMKRGWTYQEALSSRSLLIFSREMLYMIHQGKIMTEFVMPLENGMQSVFEAKEFDICRRIQDYTLRQLTYPSDILNAFTGILSLYDSQHYYGIPSSKFDTVLLWQQLDWDLGPRLPEGNNPFPSWSWSSALGQILYDRDLGSLNDVLVSVATWMISSEEGTDYRIQVVGSPAEDTFDVKRRWMLKDALKLSLAASCYRLFPIRPPRTPKKRKDFERMMKRISSCFKSRASIWEFVRGLGEGRSTIVRFAPNGKSQRFTPFIESFTREELKLAAGPARLLVYTQSINVALRFWKENRGHARIFEIISSESPNSAGDEVFLGYAWLTRYYAEKLSREPQMQADSFQSFCLALSVAPGPDKFHLDVEMNTVLGKTDEWWFPHRQLWKTWRYEPLILNVMLTVPEQSGCWSRIGLGKVSLARWRRCKPGFQTTVLE